ncbi:MAG: carboxypeptidase regulatory-like domain-containing protein [Terriglobales bacterium]
MRFTTSIRILALLAVVALLLPGMMVAQSLTEGALSGTVTDQTGAVVPGVTVKITNLAKGFSHEFKTNAQGVYTYPLADTGPYSIEVTAAGFKTFSAKGEVNVGQTTIVNAKLEVGTASGTVVEVNAAAEILQTEAADMTTNFDKTLVENLPNGGNDLTAIAYTAPGVIQNNGGGYGNFNANGLPATSNVFTIDGMNDMDPFLNLNNSGPTNLMLGKNSIEEATVVTNAYGGQYGQQAGAQVSFVSKGGTNNFHGNLQYQWTGSSLDANDWFNTTSTPVVPRPFANNNQWAASFGGPIKKDKTFFFLDTEGIRYVVPSTVEAFTPTSGFLTDMVNNVSTNGSSAATLATYKAAAAIWEAAPGFARGVAIPAGTATNPGSCYDPFFGNLVDGSANVTNGCFQSYFTSPAVPAHEWLLIGRVDQNLGNKDRAFFRFTIDRGIQATSADPLDPAAFSAESFQPAYNGGITWNHTFSGTATNQFSASLLWYRAIFDENTNGNAANGGNSPFPYSMYVDANVANFNLFGLPGITGLNGLNFVFPQGRNVTQTMLVDDFAKIFGRHNLKFGISYRRYDITNYDASEYVAPLVNSDLNEFFNGTADYYSQADPLHASLPENTGGFGIYGQDEWAVTSRLKLTVGLRVEHNFNPTCDTNCFTNLSAPWSSLLATQTDSTPYNQALSIGRKSAFNSTDAANFAPRFGFTWSPLSNNKTVVSGGIGIFYDAFPAFITDGFVNVPYLIGVNQYGPLFGGSTGIIWGDNAGAAAVTANTANAIRNGVPSLSIPSLANGLTAAELEEVGGAPPNITGFTSKLRTPQYQEWNFQIQQELDSRSRLTVAYVGNHGILEAYPNSWGNASSGYGITGVPANSPSGRFGAITQWQSGAVSNYNGLTATYSRRMTYGFVVNANFTWSHTLDEISNGGLLNYGANTDILTQINPSCFSCNNYGNADYDIRHSFNANYVWTEPYHFGNPILNAIVGGWLASENFIVRSGLPYTVTDGTVAINNGGTAPPAQVIGAGQQNCTNGLSACINAAAFASSSGLGSFPTQIRNQYHGPGFFDTDFSVNKNFKIRERMTFTVGANIYNVLNHPNFQNPHTGWTPGCSTAPITCGNINGQAAPTTGPYGSFFNGLPAGREGQFQAKLVF